MAHKDRKQIMCDIETMSTGARPAIVSVALVVMDLDTNEIIDTKDWVLDWEHQVDERGRLLDAKTVKWWFSQSEEARRVLYGLMPRSQPEEFIKEFYEFFQKHNTRAIWANGVGFDVDILDEFFDSFSQAGLTFNASTGKEIRPWHYGGVMCMRSVRQMAEAFLPWEDFVKQQEAQEGHVAHNALSDATVQARYVLEVRKWLARHQSSE